MPQLDLSLWIIKLFLCWSLLLLLFVCLNNLNSPIWPTKINKKNKKTPPKKWPWI